MWNRAEQYRVTQIFAPLEAMTPDLAVQIVELETRLTFQENTLQALNDVVTRQQQQIESLNREIQTLKERLRAATPSPVGPLEDEKPPPHY